MSASPKIVLTYFAGSGRLTPALLAFKLAGIPFERENLDHAAWAEASKDLSRFPLGDIPVMSVDGRVVCESFSIAHYAGVLTNLWPKDAFESTRTLEVFLTIEEVVTGSWGVNFMKTLMGPANPELTAEKQKELREGPFKDHFSFYLRRVNDIIVQNGDNGFTVGNSVTVVDFLVWQIVNMFASGHIDHVPANAFDAFPAIKKVAANVESIEALKETIAEINSS